MKNPFFEETQYCLEKTQYCVEKIIQLNEKIDSDWSDLFGWAPDQVAYLLSKSMLNWQTSLSKSLKKWIISEPLSDGDLILAWVNLGALAEGTIKFFLCAYYESYKDSKNIIKKYGKLIDPDRAMLDGLISFLEKEELFNPLHIEFLKELQQKRNSIHAFKEREIGSNKIFFASIHDYYDFLSEVVKRLPQLPHK